MKLNQLQQIKNLLNSVEINRINKVLLLTEFFYIFKAGRFLKPYERFEPLSYIKELVNTYLSEDNPYRLKVKHLINNKEIIGYANSEDVRYVGNYLYTELVMIRDYRDDKASAKQITSDFFDILNFCFEVSCNSIFDNEFFRILIDYICNKKNSSVLFVDNIYLPFAELLAGIQKKCQVCSLTNTFERNIIPPAVKDLIALLFLSEKQLFKEYLNQEKSIVVTSNRLPDMDIFDFLPETPLSKYDGGFTYHCRYLTYEDLSLGNNFDVYYRYFKEKIKGRFVTFLPTEITYSNKLIAKELRELFLNDRLLDKVISLPKYFTKFNSSPMVVLLFDTNKTSDEITFIDLSFKECRNYELSAPQYNVLNKNAIEVLKSLLTDDQSTESSFSVNAKISEIKSKDFVLNPSMYVNGPDINNYLANLSDAPLHLCDVASIYRAQICANNSEAEPMDTDEWYELNLADISETGLVHTISKSINIKRGHPQAIRNQLKKGDIVLSIKGSLGKVGIIREDRSDFMAGQCFAVIRSKDKTLYPPELIFMQLKSKAIKHYIQKKTSGGSIKVLQKNELNNIPLFEFSEDRAKTDMNRFNALVEIDGELNRLRDDLEDIFK